MDRSPVKMIGVALAAAAAVELVRRGRKSPDPAHAPGHRHLGPPPAESSPGGPDGGQPVRNQPWVRRSHSDSQRRRFRR